MSGASAAADRHGPKEFVAFPWAEIIFVAALSWVKKKVSGERNPDAIGCKVTVSQEKEILPPPCLINNK